MTRRNALGAAVGAVAVALLLGMPAMTLAQTAQQTSYTTTLTERLPNTSYSGYGGTLRLTTASDGTISGWYIPDDRTDFIAVTGGMNNGQMWLNIGESGRLRVDATIGKDGVLVGSATDLGPVPTDSSSPSQPITYDFVAKPDAN
jgi:hypothetical protein